MTAGGKKQRSFSSLVYTPSSFPGGVFLFLEPPRSFSEKTVPSKLDFIKVLLLLLNTELVISNRQNDVLWPHTHSNRITRIKATRKPMEIGQKLFWAEHQYDVLRVLPFRLLTGELCLQYPPGLRLLTIH